MNRDCLRARCSCSASHRAVDESGGEDQGAAAGWTADAASIAPAGCGKTLLAKAVACESGANFISIKVPRAPGVCSATFDRRSNILRCAFRDCRAAFAMGRQGTYCPRGG